MKKNKADNLEESSSYDFISSSDNGDAAAQISSNQ